MINSKIVNTIINKTTIIIVVLLSFFNTEAQTYNNWLLPGGAILNFDTSPAKILCNKINENDICKSSRVNYPVCLSDENGNVIIYSYKKEETETASSDYIIKKADKTEIISFKALEVRNAIGCKLPQGGYCIAAVFVTTDHFKEGELHIYKFDTKGNLEKKYVYKEGNYGFLLTFLYLDNYVVLVTYRKNQIETYKLTSEGCELWSTSEISLDKFTTFPTFYHNIVNSLDNTKIIASTRDITYILNFNKTNGNVTIDNKYISDKLRTFALSNNDLYFLSIYDNKLNCFRYNKKLDFDFDNPDITFNLAKDNNVVYNDWEMSFGEDDKLYIYNQGTDYILVLDEIESGNITEELISSNCLEMVSFPRIPRTIDPSAVPIPICPFIPINYSVESPDPSLVYHWQIIGGTLSNTTGSEVTVTWDDSEGLGTLSVYAEQTGAGCKSEITELKVQCRKSPSATFDNAQVCYGEPLKINLTGTAPYEIIYNLNGNQKNITTSKTEYTMPNTPGKYTITKIKDQYCEFEPTKDIISEIMPQLNKLHIIKE